MMALTSDPDPTAMTPQPIDDFYAEFTVGQQGTVCVQVAASVVMVTDVTAVNAACQQAAGACVGALAMWDKTAWEVGIRLGDAAEGQRLNEDFRHKDYVPNVLSFPDGEDGYQGDIFLTLPVVVREAAEQGKTFTDHLTHLVVHGLLHLAGYDHEDESQAEAMEALETRILATLAIADPYAEDMA